MPANECSLFDFILFSFSVFENHSFYTHTQHHNIQFEIGFRFSSICIWFARIDYFIFFSFLSIHWIRHFHIIIISSLWQQCSAFTHFFSCCCYFSDQKGHTYLYMDTYTIRNCRPYWIRNETLSTVDWRYYPVSHKSHNEMTFTLFYFI